MTLHSRLAFVLDIIQCMGGAEQAKSKGVWIEFESNSGWIGGEDADENKEKQSWELPSPSVASNQSLREAGETGIDGECQSHNAAALDEVRRKFPDLFIRVQYPRTVQEVNGETSLRSSASVSDAAVSCEGPSGI